MSNTKEHSCKEMLDLIHTGHGEAIDEIVYDEEKSLWFATNHEYSTSIMFCPWCGIELKDDKSTVTLLADIPEEAEFKQYRRIRLTEMRPYITGEDLSKVSVSVTDTPKEGGMIARNPKNPDDQWYVDKQYFEDNLELVE